MRLRTIQQPSRVEALLESFVWSANVLPEAARKVTDRSELPSALQRVAVQAKKLDRAWGCWADGYLTWFFTAEMSMSLSRERGCPVLQVSAYGESGQLLESCAWVLSREGRWHRCGG